MNTLSQKIISDMKDGNYSSARVNCEEYISTCKNRFMEELTSDAATSFAGSVILFSRICRAENKPWMAFPFLQSADGCMRFLRDFMQDRETLASAHLSFAEEYEAAGLFSQAFRFYEFACELTENAELFRDAFASLAFFVLKCDKKLSKSLREKALRLLNKDGKTSIEKEAEESFKNSLKFDPVELTDEFLEVWYDVEREVDELLSASSSDEPFCIRYWSEKKRVLKEKYSIDWKSPAECNPNIRFQ